MTSGVPVTVPNRSPGTRDTNKGANTTSKMPKRREKGRPGGPSGASGGEGKKEERRKKNEERRKKKEESKKKKEEIINFEPIPHRKAPKPGFWLKYCRFGLREGFQRTRRARRIYLGRFSAQTQPRRPISRPRQSFLCHLGSSRELGNLPSDFRDCFRTTQRVLELTSIWFLLRTEPWRPVS